MIVRQELLHERMFDHAVLSLPDVTGSHEPLYIDADGVATAYDLLECWRTRERVPDPALDDPADRVRFVGHLEEESWSCWLAQELKTRFGTPRGCELPRVLAEPTQEHCMKSPMSLPEKRSTSTEPRTAKRGPNLDQCATCNNARLVPHPDLDKAESLVIPCPDCSQITKAIRKKYLAAPSACPWCG